jgi:hypothetical protein
MLRFALTRRHRQSRGTSLWRRFSQLSGNDAVVETAGNLSPAAITRAKKLLNTHGFVVLPALIPPAALRDLHQGLDTHVKRVMSRLDAIDAPFGVGSKNGFHEVVLRSPGRFDVPVEVESFQEASIAAVEAIVKEHMGEAVQPVFCGVVKAAPKTEAQQVCGWG